MRRQVDLTEKLTRNKGARVCYHTVYARPPFYGFLDNGLMSTGIAFIRTTVKGIRTHKNGSARWYHGGSTHLAKARTAIRRRYGLQVPQDGWIVLRVKTWNHSTVEEIIEQLRSTL